MPKPPAPANPFGSKVKTHQRYYVDGKRVPGATGVLGVLSGGNLARWANNLGLAGIDSDLYRDETAAIGKLAHAMIEADLKGEALDNSDFTANQIRAAEWSFASYREWREAHDIKPLLVEGRMVSKEHRFGGTIDLYAEIDGRPGLIDFKTSKAIYLNHKAQVSGYAKMMIENEHRFKSVRIVKIGRDEGESFQEYVMSRDELADCWQIFLHALEIYRLKRRIEGGRGQLPEPEENAA